MEIDNKYLNECLSFIISKMQIQIIMWHFLTAILLGSTDFMFHNFDVCMVKHTHPFSVVGGVYC